MSSSLSTSLTSPAPIADAAEAERLVAHFFEVMDALTAIVQQETEQARAGRLARAAHWAERKGELTRLYIADALRLRASQGRLAGLMPADRMESLRARHDAFRALLQLNLTVLATSHAVAEGIVRGVSSEMARRSAPQTYGAGGRATAPGRNVAAPLAVSRVL